MTINTSLRINNTLKIKDFNVADMLNDFHHICIALISVLYVLKVPVINLSFGTIIILAYVPRSLYYIINNWDIKKNISSVFFLIFYSYLLFRSDGNIMRIILCSSAFINLFGIIKGSIDAYKLRRIIEIFALINVALLVFQVIGYYVIHIKIQYIPQSLIYEEYQNSWVFRDEGGLYRPSALFLEPSHFSQFCIFALLSTLFPIDNKVKMKRAIAIGMGCILTTSGMGILLTCCVFSYYMVMSNDSINKKVSRILKMLPVLVIALLILSQTSFFKTALDRVFSNVNGYNAVSGRTHNTGEALGKMRGATFLFGYGDSFKFRFYLTGLADSIYKYGLLCVILEGLCFLYLMLKKRGNFVWCCCVVFSVLFCVAHVTNFVSQVFYFGIIVTDANIINNKNNVKSNIFEMLRIKMRT